MPKMETVLWIVGLTLLTVWATNQSPLVTYTGRPGL